MNFRLLKSLKRRLRRTPALERVEIPPEIMGSLKAGILVCTSPRTGSNHLAGLMSAAGLGNPLEWFGGRRVLEMSGYPHDARDQVLRVVTDGRSSSGVYASKLFASQFAKVAETIDLPGSLPNLHYVRLTRGDVLGQAISWARARQTRQFRSTEEAEAKPLYCEHAITQAIDRLLLQRMAWDAWFARTGVTVLSITYEEVEENAGATIERIAAHVGLDLQCKIPAPLRSGLDVQRDEINADWRSRYAGDNGDRARFEIPVTSSAAR